MPSAYVSAIFTDAAITLRWGARLEDCPTQGTWRRQGAEESINWKEPWALIAPLDGWKDFVKEIGVGPHG